MRIFLNLINLFSVFILIWGYIKHRKISKLIKTEYGTEIINKEIVDKETLDEFKVSIRLIVIGGMTPLVTKVIWVIFLWRNLE